MRRSSPTEANQSRGDAERAAPRVGEPRAGDAREQVDERLAERGEDPRVAVEPGRDARREVVGRPAPAEREPAVGGPLAVDDEVAVVGERLPPGQPDLSQNEAGSGSVATISE